MVEKKICLNLDSRPDRWEESQKEFEKVGYKVERFSGVPGDFNRAYWNALNEVKDHESSLIFEDDVEFVKWDHIDDAFSQLPDDWDLFAIGYSLCREHKERVSENLYRYENGWATHGICYRKPLVKWILDNFRFEDGIVFDEWIRLNVLPKFNCYLIYPMACIQRASFSNLRNRFVDYTKFWDRSNAYLK